jgi:hypothetical protein
MICDLSYNVRLLIWVSVLISWNYHRLWSLVPNQRRTSDRSSGENDISWWFAHRMIDEIESIHLNTSHSESCWPGHQICLVTSRKFQGLRDQRKLPCRHIPVRCASFSKHSRNCHIRSECGQGTLRKETAFPTTTRWQRAGEVIRIYIAGRHFFIDISASCPGIPLPCPARPASAEVTHRTASAPKR